MDNFSLIWNETCDIKQSFSSLDFISDLKIDWFLNINKNNRCLGHSLSIEDFFTCDIKTIELRQELFLELLENKELYEILINSIPSIETLFQVRTAKSEVGDAQSKLFVIKEVEIYVECIDFLYKGLKNVDAKSKAFKRLQHAIFSVYESETYTNMKSALTKVSTRVSNVKSVTIGVNLDAQLRPVTAGLVSVNGDVFRGSTIMERLLKNDEKSNEYVCQTPLTQIKKGLMTSIDIQEMEIMNKTFLLSLNRALSDLITTWKPSIRRFVFEESDALCGILFELKFIQGCMDSLQKLTKRGFPVCKPTITTGTDEIIGLYNPLLATSVADDDNSPIVENDVSFDDDGKIYILTGPNQGGKSIYANSVGFAYAMLHLGLPIPAKSAKMSLVDGIYTHLSKGDDCIGKGKLAQESAHISSISKQLTNKSLFIFDEALSSTSAVEASYIAADILTAFGIIGAKGIFTTHLHELAVKVDEINRDHQIKSKFSNLCAIVGTNDNQRTYIIKKQMPDGLSFARDITKKYGLTTEDILEKNIFMHNENVTSTI